MEEATHDELAGIVDLFDALTREELSQALVELAYRRGDDVREGAVADAVDEAVAEYYLLELPADAVDGEIDDAALVVGPVAFPTLPDEGEDLPHILDVPERSVDRATAAEHAAERLRREAATAVDGGDEARVALLADVTYDVEAWGAVELRETRKRLHELVD
ncbi:hypothetical protein B4589_007435 [Halolamina sp. CBA1230]|uniref:DUF7109 family protein n=1 Tax=Halolamina sp. CBA1230 TaxID=1853690 RepID=UPI0009A19246|nr:hypothetical protein [Halolamina sp. CBA1230]QKY20216.1 hypothetical protein B4589_007435 [Halolamina sp. CBA1230]